jgi:hypothetical protein
MSTACHGHSVSFQPPAHKSTFVSMMANRWRTRIDPFDSVWPQVEPWLNQQPDVTATGSVRGSCCGTSTRSGFAGSMTSKPCSSGPEWPTRWQARSIALYLVIESVRLDAKHSRVLMLLL